MNKVKFLVYVLTFGSMTCLYAAQAEKLTEDQINAKVTALVSFLLWALVDKVIKPLFRKSGLNLTSDFKVFQPLLLSLSVAITGIVCKTGICEYLVSSHEENKSFISIAVSGILSWVFSQFIHDVQANTNTKISTSGEKVK